MGMNVVHSHRENLRETRDLLDLRLCDTSGYSDRILIWSDDRPEMVSVTLEDFQWIYEMKLSERKTEEHEKEQTSGIKESRTGRMGGILNRIKRGDDKRRGPA